MTARSQRRESAETASVPDTSTQGQRVEVSGLRKVFSHRRRGTLVAIENIDLVADPGEFVAIVGPSGCGKSTMLYCVGGFVEHSAGQITVGGEVVSGPGRDRGIVFQDFALFPWKTVMGNITYPLSEMGVGKQEREERARQYLSMMKLEGMEGLYPKELSGGMKQRTALARTLIAEPSVVLADEPLGALDAQTRAILQSELSAILAQAGRTVLFVTHSVEEAIFLADRIYVLSRRPAVVRDVIDVPISKPRDREEILRHPAYAEMHAHIWELLRQEHAEEPRGDQ